MRHDICRHCRFINTAGFGKMFFLRFFKKLRLFKQLNCRQRKSFAGIKHSAAGKTVFASGFAQGLGITESVSSPTFTIVQEYPYEKGMFYHLDLYRIDGPDAALAFGIDEFLFDPEAIALVEWPVRIDGLFPEGTVYVKILRTEEEERRHIIVERKS